ncbi:MAG TPA: DUF1338 family protein [Alphaproteobacteria bacterium]
MTDHATENLRALLAASLDEARAARLLATIDVPASLPGASGTSVPRATIAYALTMVLFDGLLDRVPAARDYVDSVVAAGRKVVFDHGALRTVAAPETGALPPGDSAFARILVPLGYEAAAVYPLDRIAMTGRAYRHRDFPEAIPQFFVSELHPERFSPAFRGAVARVLATSRDPLTVEAVHRLERLARDRALPTEEAAALVAVLVPCFARQHEAPRLADYETLLAESAEMAWIATEGNAFNHATDRVADVVAVAEAQRRAGRAIKENVEVSSTGRIRQTAFKAAIVARDFVDGDGRIVRRMVPGSFYEFISRDPLPDGSGLDLGFDAGNAQGIFKMTSAV